MHISGNTLLVTGGGSGIGRALAEAFHALGNQVIIAGRREPLLQQVVEANPGMRHVVLDTADAQGIEQVTQSLIESTPTLNGVIHCAGIMKPENLLTGELALEETVATNLLGPIRLDQALIPHLLQQPHAAVVTVSSGLAFVPMAITPTYCATKAAFHSYSQSLRYQLKDTAIKVHELAPPYVQTGLMGEHQQNDPQAMPLDAFIAEVMSIFEHAPDADEILVERVKPLRYAEREDYAAFFKAFNDQMSTAFAR